MGQQYLSGMVVEYRVIKAPELVREGSSIEGNLVEAKTGDRIDLENRDIGIPPCGTRISGQVSGGRGGCTPNLHAILI